VKAAPPPPAAATLATDLRLAVGRLVRRVREQTARGELNLSQRSALGHLEREGPSTVTALARAEGMRPQSMGAIVASLEAAGLIAGQPDPSDRRQTLLTLTDAGRDTILAGRAAREDWLNRTIAQRLSAEEQATLAAAAELMNRLAEPDRP
jgi:DNA-binding MarR family transcriptional regulator